MTAFPLFSCIFCIKLMRLMRSELLFSSPSSFVFRNSFRNNIHAQSIDPASYRACQLPGARRRAAAAEWAKPSRSAAALVAGRRVG